MCAERSSTTCAISAARLPASKKRSNSDKPSSGGFGAAFARSGAVARFSAFVLCAACLAGCANLIGSRASATLSAAILDQDDPLLVESGLPPHLPPVDGLLTGRPHNT